MKEPPLALPNFASLPQRFEGRRLLPPLNQQRQQQQETEKGGPTNIHIRDTRSPSIVISSQSVRERPRSNLTALLSECHRSPQSQSESLLQSQEADTASFSHMQEADDASGPSSFSVRRAMARSAPTHTVNSSIGMARQPPPAPSDFCATNRLTTSSLLRSSATSGRSMEDRQVDLRAVLGTSAHGSIRVAKSEDTRNSPVRRCISSKELGTLAPPSGSPYSYMLYQREVIEASLQRRLMDVRKASSGIDRSETPSPSIREADESSDSSKRRQGGKNESRNRRRAEHTREVIADLCEIVADLFLAESKLLNPTSYGVDSSFQRDLILNTVKTFVNALPPRYALGVETPSEVLVHMRLLAAARSDNTKAVVHIANLQGSHWGGDSRAVTTRGQRLAPRRSRHLVTISCQDAHGLLEYITKLLASGGSRVIDADVMLSMDNIVLDRFAVEMNGRLRLDKLSNSIEIFLAEARARDQILDEHASASSGTVSDDNSSPRSRELQKAPSGPLYFHAPSTWGAEASPQEMAEAMKSAVPLSAVLSSNALTSLVPMRRNSSTSGQLQQPFLPGTPDSSTRSERRNSMADSNNSEAMANRRRRPLVNRQATNFGVEFDNVLDYVTVPAAPPIERSLVDVEDRVVPLIPFEELMLIETLGAGRVSTIYRAAWQHGGYTPGETPAPPFYGVEMVALKVATVNPETGDTSHVDELRREADIAAMLKHPNVCDLIGVAADSECFCLAYDFCEGGSLLSLLSDHTRYYEYLPIALDIANGMAYLHSRSIIHRDLKPSNVLLSRDHRAKIADFGMSIANTGQELTAETGTYRYMAPEVIRHESYSSNADVYSFGLVLWQLITREVPFATMTPIQAAFSVAEGRRPVIPSSCPPRLRDIIESCWDQDSYKRPSFTYVAMALADYARMAFSPANVGAQTLQIANEMLANVEGNSTVNVDFSAPVDVFGGNQNLWFPNHISGSFTSTDVGLEI